jgi:hypothetical protein
MTFHQCELPLLLASKRHALEGKTKPRANRAARKLPRYRTTKEIVQLLNLNSDYMLRKAKNRGNAYRGGDYIAVPSGRNKWEIFRQLKA